MLCSNLGLLWRTTALHRFAQAHIAQAIQILQVTLIPSKAVSGCRSSNVKDYLCPVCVCVLPRSTGHQLGPVGPGLWAHSFVGPRWALGPCWAHSRGFIFWALSGHPFICWAPGPVGAMLEPFICWALLGPFICWALLGPGQ